MAGSGDGFDRVGRGGDQVPGQEFVDPVDRVLGDASEELAQVGLWVEAIELGGADEAVERRGTLAASVGSSEEIIFLQRATALNARSAAELSISMRPSRQ